MSLMLAERRWNRGSVGDYTVRADSVHQDASRLLRRARRVVGEHAPLLPGAGRRVLRQGAGVACYVFRVSVSITHATTTAQLLCRLGPRAELPRDLGLPSSHARLRLSSAIR